MSHDFMHCIPKLLDDLMETILTRHSTCASSFNLDVRAISYTGRCAHTVLLNENP